MLLADVKSKNLEIERLQAHLRDLTAEKSKLKAAANEASGRGGDCKAVLEKKGLV